jgi:hypothetical protein
LIASKPYDISARGLGVTRFNRIAMLLAPLAELHATD